MFLNRFRRSRVSLRLLAVVAVAAWAASASAQPAGPLPEIFSPPGAPTKGLLTQAESRLADVIGSRATTAEMRIAEVAATEALERSEAAFLTLLPGIGFAVDPERVERRDKGDFTYFGTIGSDFGSAILVVDRGEVTGTVRAGSEIYRIEPLGAGRHAIVRVDPNAFPPEAEPESGPSPGLVEMLQQAAATPLRNRPQPAPLSKAIVTRFNTRVLIGYTQAVRSQHSNMGSFIQLAIDETNAANADSGAGPKLDNARIIEVNYVESGSHNTDLARFRSTTDGIIDNVHTLRNTHQADVMVLLIDDDEFCGLASAIGATAATAFATVHHDCATGNYSFGHEIAHLQGARHDNDPGTTPFAFGHGFYHAPGSWRTIMGVFRTGVARIRRWSTPNRTWGGVATGTATTHDNARVLGLTNGAVAAFRLGPLNMFGPVTLFKGQTGYWTIEASSTPGAVTYRWLTSTNGNTFTFTGNTTASFNRKMFASTWIRAEATSAGQTLVNTRFINVIDICGDREGRIPTC